MNEQLAPSPQLQSPFAQTALHDDPVWQLGWQGGELQVSSHCALAAQTQPDRAQSCRVQAAPAAHPAPGSALAQVAAPSHAAVVPPASSSGMIVADDPPHASMVAMASEATSVEVRAVKRDRR